MDRDAAACECEWPQPLAPTERFDLECCESLSHYLATSGPQESDLAFPHRTSITRWPTQAGVGSTGPSETNFVGDGRYLFICSLDVVLVKLANVERMTVVGPKSSRIQNYVIGFNALCYFFLPHGDRGSCHSRQVRELMQSSSPDFRDTYLRRSDDRGAHARDSW